MAGRGRQRPRPQQSAGTSLAATRTPVPEDVACLADTGGEGSPGLTQSEEERLECILSPGQFDDDEGTITLPEAGAEIAEIEQVADAAELADLSDFSTVPRLELLFSPGQFDDD